MKDASIIGGSAAGFFTAYLLARAGLHVRLYEMSDRLDPVPRTLIVTHKIRGILGGLSDEVAVNRINRFEIFADGKVADVTLSQPDLVVERSRLIRALATRASEAGVEILAGRRFLGLKPNGKRLRFSIARNGHASEESTQVLVGADGASSEVARGAGWPPHTTAPLIQALVHLPPDHPPDTTRVWFLPGETPYFYWSIPHSETRAAVGLIAEDETRGRAALDRFLERKGVSPIGFQAARIPVYRRWVSNHRRWGENHVYLVGDAAGHVKVSTVGGIVTGLAGALGVSEAILNGGVNGRLRALRRELDRHCMLRRVLHGFSQDDYVRLLDLLSPSAKRILGSSTRDETGRLLLHLFLYQPRILLMGMKALLPR